MHETVEIARPALPPFFEALRHDGPEPVLAHAVRVAAERGAGTLVWSARPGSLAFALVLEPDRPLALARPAFLVGMAALAEALAAHCLPERPVAIRWPGTLIYDGAEIGAGRLVWPAGCAETEEPAWMVFGAELIADRRALADPGLDPHRTSLEEEAIEDGLGIVESSARNLMLLFDTWAVSDLGRAAAAFLQRLEGARGPRRVEPTGDILEGDAAGEISRRALAPALAGEGGALP
jgi:Biotin/lipoate A/B protein ligase family